MIKYCCDLCKKEILNIKESNKLVLPIREEMEVREAKSNVKVVTYYQSVDVCDDCKNFIAFYCECKIQNKNIV